MTSPLYRLPAKSRESRTWPAYLLGGRVRTSTLGLIVAFFVAYWVHQTYAPPPPAPTPPPAVVPPGFVPNPEYTWVPRTEVNQYPKSTHRSTPTETTEPTETTTSSTTSSTSPSPTTTVFNPVPGILPPITLPVQPGQTATSPPPPGPVTTTVISPGTPPAPSPSQ